MQSGHVNGGRGKRDAGPAAIRSEAGQNSDIQLV
jgi:hypothetical protein